MKFAWRLFVAICRSCGNFHRRQGKRTDCRNASAFGKNISNVQMNRIVDIAECLLVGIALRIAALQSRARNKIAIAVMLDDYREMIGFHWWRGRSVRKLLQVLCKSRQLLLRAKNYEHHYEHHKVKHANFSFCALLAVHTVRFSMHSQLFFSG